MILYFSLLYRLGYVCLHYDSCVIRTLLRGEVTGQPDAHTIYFNYVFGSILILCYRIFPMLNWFSLLLLFTCLFALWAILFQALSSARRPAHGAVFVILTLLLHFYTYGQSMMDLNYTSSASIAGISAVCCLILPDRLRARDILLSSLLMILCAGIRFQVFAGMLPFLLVAVLLHLSTLKQNRRYAAFLLTTVVVIGSLWMADHLAYTGAYARSARINACNTELWDYDRWIPYTQHEAMFRELGIDELEYRLMKVSLELSDKPDETVLHAIADAHRAEETINFKLQKAMGILNQMIRKDYTAIVWMLVLLSVLSGAVLLMRTKEPRLLIIYLALLGLAVAEILYLAYEGRMPVRTSQGPLALFCLTGFSFSLRAFEPAAMDSSSGRQRILIPVVALLLLIPCVFSFIHASDQIRRGKNLVRNDLKLVHFMAADTDHIYFVHNLSEPLDLLNPIHMNHMGWGGWCATLIPWKQALMGPCDNVWDAIAYREDLRIITRKPAMEIIQEYMNRAGYDVTLQTETIPCLRSSTILWHGGSPD
ncbi:MAG: hypothetical protein IJT34_05455 [Butyrivibrio sp.]|nr:hypothetical protein [Butyrivibrio sp.]